MMQIRERLRDRIPEPVRRFWREKIAPRPIASGSIASVVLGVAMGGVLAAGSNFEAPPPMQPVAPRALRAPEATPQPITFMKGADGKIPDWVIGTDNIPGRQTWRDRLPVETVPDEEDVAPPRRGLGWLLQPWRWGREEPAPRPSRRLDSDRVMDRQAVMEQYERDRARYERDRAAWERRYAQSEAEAEARRRPRYDTRYPPTYEPAPDPRDERDYEPGYDPGEEAPYAFQQPPPPQGRWGSGR